MATLATASILSTRRRRRTRRRWTADNLTEQMGDGNGNGSMKASKEKEEEVEEVGAYGGQQLRQSWQWQASYGIEVDGK